MLILNTGTQYVEGDLSFDPGFQIFLYDSVFSQTGDYVLFDYSLGSFSGGQSELDNNVSVTAVDLKLSYLNPLGGVAVLENQPEHNRVVVKLLSKPGNGKQWVEGDLNFAGPTTIYLDQHLFTTPGVYELFEVTGDIYNVENLTAIQDGGFLAGTPFVDPLDNKKVKINLVKAIGINNANVSQSYAIAPEIVQLTKTIHLSLSQTVVSSVISPAIIPTLLIGTSAVSSYAYEPLIEQKASLETTVATAYSMSPDVIQGLSTQTCSSLSYVFDPSFKINIGSETASVIAFAFSPAVEQKIQINVSITLNSTFSPAVIQKCLIAGSAVVETSCIDPITKRVSTPSSVGSTCFNPALEQKISLSTTSVVSSVFRLRMGIGESNWYSYFPMACFDGSISIDSTFKIMILGEESIFNADQRYISDVPGHLNGISKNITLKNVYINNIGDVVYDFDSVTFEQQDFVFQNAVIYANNYLVLHINWARDFSLIDQSVTIDVPEVNAIARPVMPFGTLVLEPYIRDPATVYATAINPEFPFVYPGVATVYSTAFSPNFVKLEPECAFADATAFNPSIQFEIDEIEDGPDLIELTEDEGFAEAYCIAFDPFAIQILVLDFTPVVAKAFVPTGPPQEITLDEISYSSAFAFNPILEAQLRLACATAYAASHQSSAKYILNIDTATAVSAQICPPIVVNEINTDPEGEFSAPALSLCSDPFVEWKPTNRISMENYSKLVGYWSFDKFLKDDSGFANNASVDYASGDENTLNEKFEQSKFNLGFRGNSILQSGNIVSDRITVNHKYGFEKNYSAQIWAKIDKDQIFLDGQCVLIEQIDGCFINNNPVFPGSSGWTLYSTPFESDKIKFVFLVINHISTIKVEAIFNAGDDGIFSNKNTWHHFACVRNENKLILYVDGIRFDTNVGEGEFTNKNQIYGSFSSDLMIGCTERPLNGILRSVQLSIENPVLKNDTVIDDIAIWAKSLTDEDINFIWAGGAGNSANSLPRRRTNINTRTIDRFRQGVELTQERYFHVGIHQSYSGDRVHHRLLRHDFGLQIWDYGNCKHYFVDKEGFKEEDFVQTVQYEKFLIGERRSTDGVISSIRDSDIKSIIDLEDNRENSITRTSFVENNLLFISDIPSLPFVDNKINFSINIKPFDDEFDTNEIVLTGVPNGFISQPNGTDYDLRIIRGTDSLAFGGETY